MMRSLFSLALLICLLTGLTAVAQSPAVVTLRSLGAVGDGKTDDRAAIEAALNNAKGPIDGEGLTYAVRGNIVVRVATDFRNAKLVQTMEAADTTKFITSGGELTFDPPTVLRSTFKGFPVMHPGGVGLYSGDRVPTDAELAALMSSIQLVTLTIRGEVGQLISVKLDKITIDRGNNPQSGSFDDGRGLLISHASPVVARDLEITGDGKGRGLGLSDSKQVLFERLNIHDMNWAPYAGDTVLDELTAAEVRDDIGWNNFPIYEYRDAHKRFARGRIREQLVGMHVATSDDVQIIDSKIERLQVKIGGELYPLQSDGITVNRIKGLVIRNCQVSRVWEGIDFTGGGGEDFVFENCTVSDTLACAFKLAHPKKNGKMINCTAIRGGHFGFTMEAEAENIQLINCQALETGGNKNWMLPAGTNGISLAGFRIAGKQIRIENCSAVNKEHPDAIDYGLLCESDPVANDIKVVNFTATGVKLKPLQGITADAQPLAATADVVTLRSLGAVGDGKTDDRAAIEAALNNAKGPIDGEGLTYAVHGNIEVNVATDFRNAKLVQTMEAADTAKFVPSEGELTLDPPTALRSTVKGFPVMHPEGVGLYSGDPIPTDAERAALMPSIKLVTLSIQGDNGQLIPVKLDKITIDRGDNPQSGGRNDGRGLQISHASPVVARDLEITGDGKGAGLNLSDSKQVLLERLNIHDMNWAPYAGDTVLDELTAAEVRDVIGWNNFPIYEYRDALKRFARVRIQEQLVGMFVSTSDDVQIIDSRIERLQVKIGGELYPLQCDGITVNRIKGLAIKNCQISRVWEGIDFTGAAGQDFVFENCTVSDTLAYAIKLAHPKQNGKLINCTAIRGGHAGFALEAEAENIELINCQALETAGNKDWLLPDSLYAIPLSAFRIAGKNIRIENCAAINKEHPGAIDYGLWCESDPVANDIKVVNFTSVGAKLKPLEGITDSAPAAK